ncbi:hypothetical protein COV49_00120 [Candidatus Falkowbacteria bacterium CG11_big_fil_rev_8_21_14_0_20_39_10]|uniref:DUF7670 domain-containing protein n=1 Tax=Candidatus Falkowbacteria bacterium CG11_big_fil_rev_8_21_14_0_20_39_10 TaxID=1974570 RepID=A0A2M6KAM0_9BACT|nr:MAG: hypothetical protein COV49_00120 [Candidatus Falkowbacteria bacterium CG11_big_fil_rev_8_21_14_0_20_39_10]
MKNQLKLAAALRYIAKTILVIIAVFWFIFSWLSGAGSGLEGVIANSPNAIAWLILPGLVYLAQKKELLAGTLISFLGLFTIFFFNAAKHHFVWWAISLPLILLGGFLILAWYLSGAKSS